MEPVSSATAARPSTRNSHSSRAMTPDDVEAVVGVRFVSEVCEEYEKSGVCVKKSTCRKAHGGYEEVRAWSAWFESRPSRNMPRDANGNYKRALCRTFTERGACPYFGKCMFAHGEVEMQAWRAWREACPIRRPVPTCTRWTLDSSETTSVREDPFLDSDGDPVSESDAGAVSESDDNDEWMREIDAHVCGEEDPPRQDEILPEELRTVLDIVATELRDVADTHARIWSIE